MAGTHSPQDPWREPRDKGTSDSTHPDPAHPNILPSESQPQCLLPWDRLFPPGRLQPAGLPAMATPANPQAVRAAHWSRGAAERRQSLSWAHGTVTRPCLLEAATHQEPGLGTLARRAVHAQGLT